VIYSTRHSSVRSTAHTLKIKFAAFGMPRPFPSLHWRRSQRAGRAGSPAGEGGGGARLRPGVSEVCAERLGGSVARAAAGMSAKRRICKRKDAMHHSDASHIKA